MELKFIYCSACEGMAKGSNCTFMELKLRCFDILQDPEKRSNCTFMELKSLFAW